MAGTRPLYNSCMKITTKTGDRGETSLFGGHRVSKASRFIELVGELDELQSYVGWARCALIDAAAAAILDRVQEDLYRMMAIVGFEMNCPDNVMTISEEDVEFLEKYIIEGQDSVKDLGKFIRPGSCEVAARLHIARTVCRRVERRMVAANETAGVMTAADAVAGGEGYGAMLKYLNSLSDLLFIMAYKFER